MLIICIKIYYSLYLIFDKSECKSECNKIMKIKYSIKFFLETRIAEQFKTVDIKKINLNDREKYYEQLNNPIRLTFTYNNKRLLYNVGYSIDRKYWDNNNSCVTKNAFNKNGISYNVINKRISELRIAFDEIYTKAVFNNEDLSIDELRDRVRNHFRESKILDKGNGQENDLYSRFEQFLEGKKNVCASSYIKQLKSCRNHLINCFGKKKIMIDSINYQFLEKFKNYYLEKHSKNSFATGLKRFKYFLNYCHDNGWLHNLEYKKYTFTEKYRNKPIFLNWDEILHLYNINIEDPILGIVRDGFILQSMIGCRYDDFIHLTKDNIKEVLINNYSSGKSQKIKVLSFVISKTKTQIEVPLNNIALKIIDKYKEETLSLVPTFRNQKFNYYLKGIGEIARLNRKVEIIDDNGKMIFTPIKNELTSHMARRNFIGNHINRFATPESVIKSMTGHTNDSKSFSRYYDILADTKYRAILLME